MNVCISSLRIVLKWKDSARGCTVLVSLALLIETLTNIFSWIRQTTGELPSILSLKHKSKDKIYDGTAVNVSHITRAFQTTVAVSLSLWSFVSRTFFLFFH